MEIVLKYSGNTIEINRACLRKAGKLGEIHQNHISTYFTEPSFRRQAKRSLFPLYFHHISFLLFPRARSGYFFYFYRISSTSIPQLKHSWTRETHPTIWGQNSKLRHHDAI